MFNRDGGEKVEKWKMYMEIHQLLQQGFSKTKIAKRLGISRTTVYRYIKRNPDTMAQWIHSTKRRKRKLDEHKITILRWLRENPDMSAAQVLDWLLEKYSDFQVAESTVRLYVRELREKYDIPKQIVTRDYEAVPEAPLGSQVQVDFGESIQQTYENKTIRLYCVSFVLSRSRFKYMEWLDRPFTTRDLIRSHENAFQYFGGIADELVYDQDSLILVSENSGDLILTGEFQAYKQERKLVMRMCRKADPESKGKIESVIKYVKNNFAKHRIYQGIDAWNESAWRWLERTGNYKHHNTTKKRPVEVFAFEKQHLRPVSAPIATFSGCDSPYASSITRSVRKDNTIWYKSNRYSVPTGTFNKIKQVYIVEDNEKLLIKDMEEKNIIAQHNIAVGKGNLIQDSNHLRDRTKGIDAYMKTVASYFSDNNQAMNYLQKIRERFPRYMRDQLQTIIKAIKNERQETIDEALYECIKRGLYSGTEFIDVIQYLNRQRYVNSHVNHQHDIKPIHPSSESSFQINIQKRGIEEYVAVMEGDKR